MKSSSVISESLSSNTTVLFLVKSNGFALSISEVLSIRPNRLITLENPCNLLPVTDVFSAAVQADSLSRNMIIICFQ